MTDHLSKFARAELFRSRLAGALAASGHSKSALARAIGADRSTLSQALSGDGARLPSAHVIGALAAALGVSGDWLLGLSDRPENAADLLSASLSFSHAPRALIDERIFNWHKEAAGYKIRHVPAALPDMIKTQAVLEWEYGPHLGRTTTQAINASKDRLEWMQNAQSDYEIAMPMFELQSFAAGSGYYEGLPPAVRRAQLDHLIGLCAEHYPRLRIYLFDARRLYSAPITVFGPLLAVLFTGGHYMAFRDRERVEIFTRDFDQLVKEATITARALPEHLQALRAAL